MKSARRVVLVGCAPRSIEHPADAEVWVVIGLRTPPRWDRLFQLHGLDHLQHKHGNAFIAALADVQAPRRLYMTKAYPADSAAPRYWDDDYPHKPWGGIPAAERFPIERVKAEAGSYLTSSFAMLIPFAVMEGFTEIIFDGVMWEGGRAQWGAGEGWAVPCIEYHLGRAAAQGVKYSYPAGCGLFEKSDWVYGFEGPGSV